MSIAKHAMALARRVGRIPRNVFADMDARVERAVNQGVDVIDLSKANPDLATPEFIVAEGKQALDDLSNHRYSQFDGKPVFLQAAQEWYRSEQHVDLTWQTQLLATCGAAVGLSTLTQVVLSPGDVLLVPGPYYPPYAAFAAVAGAELVVIACSWETGFLPDFSTVDESVWSRVKLLLLNYPNNPTGAVASARLYRQAVKLAHRYHFWVANDFAYAGLNVGRNDRSGLLAAVNGDDVAVETVSMSKMYGMAGWRLGFIAGPARLMRHIRAYHHQMCSTPAGAVQDAGAVALLSDQSSVSALAQRYADRRAALTRKLREAGFDVFDSRGALFLWLRVPGGLSSQEFANRLLEEARVAAMPGDCFGREGEGYVRLSLLQSEQRLTEAARRIGRKSSYE